MNSTTLLFIKNHGPLAPLLKETLHHAPGLRLVGEVEVIEEGLELLQTTPVDVVILDLNLAKMCGLDAIPMILEKASSAKVILLLDQDDHRYRRAAANKGASACVLKQAIATELIPIIHAVLAS